MTGEKLKLNFDCKERVAYDMAMDIWLNEDHTRDNSLKEIYRKEFIKLYTECYAAVSGNEYKYIFPETD